MKPPKIMDKNKLQELEHQKRFSIRTSFKIKRSGII